MNIRMLWRKTINVVMLSLTGVCALIAVSALFFILGYLVYHGGKDINWAFFTKLPTPVGEAGGAHRQRRRGLGHSHRRLQASDRLRHLTP